MKKAIKDLYNIVVCKIFGHKHIETFSVVQIWGTDLNPRQKWYVVAIYRKCSRCVRGDDVLWSEPMGYWQARVEMRKQIYDSKNNKR